MIIWLFFYLWVPTKFLILIHLFNSFSLLSWGRILNSWWSFLTSTRVPLSQRRLALFLPCTKKYETYYRSARVQFSNKFWTILKFEVFNIILNHFHVLSWTFSGYLKLGSLGLSRAIWGYLGLSLAIFGYLGYLGLYLAISGHLGLSQAISGYLWLFQAMTVYFRLSLAISIRY